MNAHRPVALALSMSLVSIASAARADDAAPPAQEVVAQDHASGQPVEAAIAPVEARRAPHEAHRPRRTNLRSPGLVAGGAVLAGVGTISIVGGAVLIATSTPSGGMLDFSGFGRVGGGILTALGVGSVIGGVAMIGVGAEQVPVSSRLSFGFGPTGVSFAGRF